MAELEFEVSETGSRVHTLNHCSSKEGTNILENVPVGTVQKEQSRWYLSWVLIDKLKALG